MKKNLGILALAFTFALVGNQTSFAKESNLDKEINNLKQELTKKEEEYKILKDNYDQNIKISKYYVSTLNQKKRITTNPESARKKLFDTSLILDEYVENGTPSIDQGILRVYLTNGFNNGKVKIDPMDADGLLAYLKTYYVPKSGVNQKVYDNLLKEYAYLISDSVVLPKFDDMKKDLDQQLYEKKAEIDSLKKDILDIEAIKNKGQKPMLEKAVANAEKTIQAAEYLKKNYPSTIKNVRTDLDKLIEIQKANLTKAKALLARMK